MRVFIMPENLTFYEYERLAAQTVSEQTKADTDSMIMASALGFAGEAGEFCDRVKKLVFHGHLLTQDEKDKLRDEVGDLLWYCALAADGLDTTLEWIARKNIEKLRERYPNGFETERSQARYESGTYPSDGT